MEATKQNNLKWYLGLTIIGLILIGIFFGCPREKVPATVEVTIPATTGKIKAVKPKQESITKANVKNNPIYVNLSKKEREFFQFQLDSLLSLTNAYEKEFIYSDSVKKNNLYKEAIQLKSFNQPFENDKIKINASGLVRGTIESIGFDYEIKEQKINVEIPRQKETYLRVLVGGGFGMNKELNQPVWKANLGFQNKKGNIIRGSFQKIGSQDYYLAEYDFSILNWKR